MAAERLNVRGRVTVATGEKFSIRAGTLIVRFAASDNEIMAAHSLRYGVFYEEMNANPSSEMQLLRSDFDSFDEICDHLLVICEGRADLPSGVVGTYRILRQRVAIQSGGFYSSDEFDLTPLLDFKGEIMELGRSCVDPEYPNGPPMQLLWQAIAYYVGLYNLEIIFGCASFKGKEIENMKGKVLFYNSNVNSAVVEIKFNKSILC